MSLMFTSHTVRSTTLPQGLWIIFSSCVMISGRRRRHWVFQIDFWCFEAHKPSAIKLHYIQDKADISRWACSTTGNGKNMYFDFGVNSSQDVSENCEVCSKCMFLKLPRHTCVNCIRDQGLVEMYMKTELRRTTLHTHTLICRVIKESMETCMNYSHIIFFSYCTWKAMELARARKTRRGNEAL